MVVVLPTPPFWLATAITLGSGLTGGPIRWRSTCVPVNLGTLGPIPVAAVG